ncbi:MAG: DUF1573 domain-containing protein [Thermodesulfobacteriota bacterium]
MSRKEVLVAVLLCALSTLPSAWAGPRIGFTEREHDFGDVPPGKTLSVEFMCGNTGDELLILERITSSCGCAKTVRGSRSIAPGSSAGILAKVDPSGMPPGRHAKTITVHSNDPDCRQTDLRLTFNVVRHLTIEPAAFAVSLLDREKDALFPVKITNHSNEPITLRASQTDNSCGVTLLPHEVLVPPGGKVDLQLSVRVNPQQQRPHLNGSVLIETSDPWERDLTVPYFIRLPKSQSK